jgi:hypothetical protein
MEKVQRVLQVCQDIESFLTQRYPDLQWSVRGSNERCWILTFELGSFTVTLTSSNHWRAWGQLKVDPVGGIIISIQEPSLKGVLCSLHEEILNHLLNVTDSMLQTINNLLLYTSKMT